MSEKPDPRVALVADDDDISRLALATLLKRDHAFDDVLEAPSLDAALAMLGELKADPRLALFDLAMPGMVDAASLIAVRECFPSTSVVVVTASMQRRDVLRALEAGVHGFVSKGQGLIAISHAIEAVLSGAIHVPTWLADPPAAGTPQLLSGGGGSQPPQSLPEAAPFPQLTQRQSDVLALVAQGKSNKEIARAMLLAEGTVKVHVAALLRAFNVSTRAAVAAASTRVIEGGKDRSRALG